MMMKKATLALSLHLLGVTQLTAEIIPFDRRIAWSPGVRGDIPNRTDIINVRQAPYNATGNGTTDDWAAIQTAIHRAKVGQVVYLPRGIYQIGAALSIGKEITLRGDGPDNTTINYVGSSGIDILQSARRGRTGPPIAITNGNTKGSTTIAIASASAIAVNSYILITHDNITDLVRTSGPNEECHWCGNNIPFQAMTQVNKVLAKNADTLTLERPLYFDYANSPVIKPLAMVENVGLEDLLVRRSNPNARDGSNISLNQCANCWVKNVKSDMAGHRHVLLKSSYSNTVRDSWFSDGYDHGAGRSYGIFLFGWNSDHLIQNNIIYRCRHALILEGGGSGNVFGYNYSVGSITEPDRNWLTEDISTHGAHPFMNLFEGNVAGKLSHDNTWGSGSHNTTFRSWLQNYSSGAVTPTYGRFAVDVEENNYYNSIVGSIIGRQGDTGLRYATDNAFYSGLISYRFGFPSPGRSGNVDPSVKSLTLIHGNYDYIGAGTVWDERIADRTLPASLYLSAKPAWFGALAWPAFGPDLSPNVGTIPAVVRYHAGTAP